MKKLFVPELFLSLSDGYTKTTLLKDIISGVIVGIIALPLSIALAIASGATPAAGLITAIFAGATAGLLGGSKTQISGPTGAFVTIVFGIITKFGMTGLMFASFMAGIFLLIFGFLKFGKFVKYIPLPIITGFTAGIAVTIAIGQLNDFFGLNLSGLPAETLEKLLAVVKGFTNISWISLAMGVVAVLIIVFVPKINKYLPGPLIAIIICTIVNIFLPIKCITMGDIYGQVSVEITPSFGFFDFSNLKYLILPAIKIAFLAAIESLLSAVAADNMANTKTNPNMELIGQGAANIMSSVFGGLPATGAIARTSANIKNGGKTPVAALTHAVILLFFSLFLMRFAIYIPMTVFAAILFVVCYNMMNVKEIKKVLKTTPVDIGLMALTFALTVIFDLVVAILVCTVASLAYQIIKRFLLKKNGIRRVEGNCLVLKGDLNYINYEKMLEYEDKLITLNLSGVDSIDATVISFLETKAARKELRIIASNDKLNKLLGKHIENNCFTANNVAMATQNV